MSGADLTGAGSGTVTTPEAVKARRREIAVLVLLVSLGWFAQGSRAIWEPDEGRYTAVALQMVRTGDWINPRLNHEVLHFTKPPLVYWLLAGAFETFGINELSARLPNALAWLALVLMLTALARRLAPDRPLLTAAVWSSSLLPFVAVNIVTTDLVLTAAECLAVLGFVAWWKDGHERSRLYWMWLGFGLAFLVKGPPGLLPLLPIIAFLAWERPTAQRNSSPSRNPAVRRDRHQLVSGRHLSTPRPARLLVRSGDRRSHKWRFQRSKWRAVRMVGGLWTDRRGRHASMGRASAPRPVAQSTQRVRRPVSPHVDSAPSPRVCSVLIEDAALPSPSHSPRGSSDIETFAGGSHATTLVRAGRRVVDHASPVDQDRRRILSLR